MSATIINIILWIPFLIVFGICAVFFMRSGYKRGVISALVSLGATVVAAVVSMLLANLIALPIAPSIASAFDFSSTEGILGAFAEKLAEGVIGGFVSLFLFSVLMLIGTLVFKKIAKKLEKDKFATEVKAKKWGGLGIRFADALIFAVLLLLPLYGTLNAYTPAARILVEFEGGRESTELLSTLKSFESHPCVYLSKPAPISTIYNGLTSIDMDGESISIPEILSVAEEVYEMGEELLNAVRNDSFDESDIANYVDFLHEEVVNQSWAYSVSREVINVARDEIASNDVKGSYEYEYFWKPIIEDMPLTEELFRENGKACLNFVKFTFENLPESNLSGEESYKYLTEKGFFEELGKLANSTNEAVFLKRCAFSVIAAEYLGNNSDAVSEFMEKYPSKAITDPELIKKDGEAIYLFLDGDNITSLLTAPGIGADAFERVIESVDIFKLFEADRKNTSNEHRDYLDNNKALRKRLCDFLHMCENAPYTDASAFSEYYPCIRLFMNDTITDYNLSGYGAGNPGALSTALRLLSEEYFLAGAKNTEAAKSSFTLLTDFAEGMTEEEGAEGEYDMAADCLDVLLSVIDMSYNNSENDFTGIPSYRIRTFVLSSVINEISKDIINTKSNDPYGTGKKMSSTLKQALTESIDTCYSEMAAESTGYITIYAYNSSTGTTEQQQIAIKDITDEQLEMFGITRTELEAKNLSKEQIKARLDLFKKLFGI